MPELPYSDMTLLAMSSFSSSLRPVSCVVMGSLCGFLIGLPIAMDAANSPDSSGISSFLVLGAGLLAGALVGYRRRNSTAFFYFSLVCVLVLASTVSLNLFEWKK